MGSTRVCYIYQDEYPWDIRAEKIVTSLASHGFDTHVLSRNRNGVPTYEVAGKHLFYHRLPAGLGPRSRALLNFPAFFSPVWLATTVRHIRRERIDVLIVRDLPLAPMAWAAARITGARVIIDMAENYPAMIQDTWTFRGRGPFDVVLRNPAFLRFLERQVFPHLDGFLVVSEASRERVVAMTGGKVPTWVVGNTPRLEAAASVVSHPIIDEVRRRGALSLLYVGGLEESRGVEIPVRALPQLRDALGDVLLVVAGRGTSEPLLQRVAAELGVTGNVLFGGWVDPAAVRSIIAACDIGLIPHYATEHTDTTIPNKIYDYMAESRPVVVSSARSLRDIVTAVGSGVAYQDKDPADFARAVLSISAPETRAVLGEAGAKAVREEFNWAVDAGVLVDAVERVAAGGAR